MKNPSPTDPDPNWDELRETFRRVVREELSAYLSGKFPQSQAERYLTAEEAANFLKVSINTLYKYRKQARLPVYRIGGLIRYKHSDLIHLLEQLNQKG